jgi:hypothetical protein
MCGGGRIDMEVTVMVVGHVVMVVPVVSGNSGGGSVGRAEVVEDVRVVACCRIIVGGYNKYMLAIKKKM